MNAAHLEDFVRNLNATWQCGDLAGLRQYYADDVVMLLPDGGLLTGVDAMIDSYRDFLDQAELIDLQIPSIVFFPAGSDTVMCHFQFRVTYCLGNERFTDEGTDAYLIGTASRSPAITWRTQVQHGPWPESVPG